MLRSDGTANLPRSEALPVTFSRPMSVNAPSEPIGALVFYPGFSFYGFATLDSYPESNGNIVENVDSSLRSVTGYDNVTGLGAPWVPALVKALGGRGE